MKENTVWNEVHGKLRCVIAILVINVLQIYLNWIFSNNIPYLFPLRNKFLQSQHNRQVIDVTQPLSNFPRVNDFLSD